MPSQTCPPKPSPPPRNPSRPPGLQGHERVLTNEENLALIDINYGGPTPRDTPRASIETTHSSRRLLPPRPTTANTSSSSSSSEHQHQRLSPQHSPHRRRSPTITIDPIPRLHPSPVRSPSRSPQNSRSPSSRNGTRASRRRNSGTARRGNNAAGKDERRVWTASDYSIEGMSEKEIERCRKKGINPRLKAEMDAAMRGRRFGPLVGNTYIG